MLRDEVRHRDFGWTALEWLLSLPQGPSLREEIARNLPAMVQGLIANYGGMVDEGAEDAGDARITAAARSWGLMARADYRRAIDLCLRRDLRPRFAKLGIRLND